MPNDISMARESDGTAFTSMTWWIGTGTSLLLWTGLALLLTSA